MLRSSRSNPLSQLNYLHRFAGRLFVLLINIHGFGYFYAWALNAATTGVTFNQQLVKPSHLSGFVGLVAANLLFVSSLAWVREKFHGTFKVLHVVSIIALFVSVRDFSSVIAVSYPKQVVDIRAFRRLPPLPLDLLGILRV